MSWRFPVWALAVLASSACCPLHFCHRDPKAVAVTVGFMSYTALRLKSLPGLGCPASASLLMACCVGVRLLLPQGVTPTLWGAALQSS